MGLIIWIDTQGQRVATALAHGFQRMFGPSAFWLVAMSMQGMALLSLLGAASYWVPMPWLAIREPAAWLVGVVGISGALLSLASINYQHAERAFQSSGQIPIHANILFVAEVMPLVALCLRVAGWIVGVGALLPPYRVGDIGAVLFLGVFYFGAVTPLPPAPGKVGAWLRRLSRVGPLVLAPAGARR